MEVSVRRIRENEWERLREIRLKALADSPSAFGSSYAAEVDRDDEFWIERAVRSAAGEASTTFIATLDAGVNALEAVGLVSAFRPAGAVVELVSMWTSPVARRTGTARRLVDAVTGWAAVASATERATAVELWVTRGNEPAYRLYASCGFLETGDHQPLPSDPCKDEIRMRLDLARA